MESHNKVPVQALKNPRPASALAPDAAPALDGRDVPQFAPDKWLIAQESADRVMLMNKLGVPYDDGRGDVREYEYIVISTNSMASEPGKSAWAVVGSSACTPTLDLGDLTAGAVTLNASMPPAPESDRLALLVTEFNCNSGQNAEGRVEIVKLARNRVHGRDRHRGAGVGGAGGHLSGKPGDTVHGRSRTAARGP